MCTLLEKDIDTERCRQNKAEKMNSHVCVRNVSFLPCYSSNFYGKSVFSWSFFLFPSASESPDCISAGSPFKKREKNQGFYKQEEENTHFWFMEQEQFDGQRRQGNALQAGCIRICMCVTELCVYVCVFVKAVYGCMSVQSLGSYSSAPTHHWMNIKLYLSGQQRWGVGNTIMLEGVSQSLWWIQSKISCELGVI